MMTNFFAKSTQQEIDRYSARQLPLPSRLGVASDVAVGLEAIAKKHGFGFYDSCLTADQVVPLIVFVGYRLEIPEQHVLLCRLHIDLAAQFAMAGFFGKTGDGLLKSQTSNHANVARGKRVQKRPWLSDGLSPHVLQYLQKTNRHVEFDSKCELQDELVVAYGALNAAVRKNQPLQTAAMRERLEVMIEADDHYSVDRVKEFLSKNEKSIAVQAIPFSSLVLKFAQQKAREYQLPYVAMVVDMTTV